MKELSKDQLDQIHGGDTDIVGFVDGFCAGVGLVALFTAVGTPLGVGCAAWGAIRLF
jgi:hypothetical protein